MRYEARVTAFDVMDQVHIVVLLTCDDYGAEEGHATVLATSTDVPGLGEDDARQWLRDALCAAIEAV